MTPYTLYRSVMDQSRLPVFFEQWGVPDTIEGRFDLLIAHSVLVLKRLKAVQGERAEEAADRSQNFADVLFKDLDRAMRETGVSDVGVPKKMNKLASAFFGRGKAFTQALDAQDRAAMIEAVQRNFSETTVDRPAEVGEAPGSPLNAEALADYLIRVDASLHDQSDDDLLSGMPVWPSWPENLQQAGDVSAA
ncbi:MAG: ubiquinol-cytochrome C chaperone family protein [Pseudomonadota bacterium]